LRERFAAQMDEHPLRREIIATGVVNNFVNNAGTTFYYRIAEETGAVAQEIARAHTVARIVYDLQSVWEGVEALDCEVDATVQTVMRLEARKLSERATRWLLANRRPPLDIAATIDTFAEGVRDLSTALPDLLRGSDHAAMQRRLDELVAAGVPEELAQRVAGMAPSLAALDIVEVAAASGQSVEDVGRVYFDLAERLRLTRLLDRILALPRDDRWKALARAALRDDLYAAHASLTADVVEASDDDTAAAADRFAEWQTTHEAALTRAMSMLDQISAAETFDLATLSVALRVIRSLLRTRSAA
jgi:glutamate dehydrogenase